jgi:hypothetical protein
MVPENKKKTEDTNKLTLLAFKIIAVQFSLSSLLYSSES